jgi:iron complex transport system permease protein
MMANSNVEKSYAKRSRQWKLTLTLLIVALLVAILVALNIGYAPISFSEILNILGKQIPGINSFIDPHSFSTVNQAIILQIRFPRVLAGALIGAGLAASGVLYQGVFKNPMADPFVLGVSSGAVLGAGLAIVFASGLSLIGIPIVQACAFAGGLITIFIVFNISKVGSRVSDMTLLLSGIAITIFLSAIFQILQVTSQNAKLHALVTWLIGGISTVSWGDILSITPFIFIGIILSYFYTRDLNMIALGEDTAQHLGVNTQRTKKIVLALGSMMASAAVSISGLIGFVGLMIPHMTRILIGPDHRILLPASVVVGGIFLVICDALARVITGAGELPVGVITALAGGPFFIFLLRRKKLNYKM